MTRNGKTGNLMQENPDCRAPGIKKQTANLAVC